MATPQPRSLPNARGVAPPPPRTPGPGLWSVVATFVVIVVLAVAITALMTTAIVRSSSASMESKANSTSPIIPQHSAAQQYAAQQNVCHVFDLATTGQQGQGGLRSNGQLNIPVIIRTLNCVVAIQDALTDKLPQNVSDAAHKYVHSALELTTAAMNNTVSNDEGNRLNEMNVSAIFALADICGLPH